jgi:hypothetical protein
MNTENNEEQSTDSECNVVVEKPSLRERLLDSGFKRPERDYSQTFLGHNPIVQSHLEFNRLARVALRKDGIYQTKNHTILKVIK